MFMISGPLFSSTQIIRSQQKILIVYRSTLIRVISMIRQQSRSDSGSESAVAELV